MEGIICRSAMRDRVENFLKALNDPAINRSLTSLTKASLDGSSD